MTDDYLELTRKYAHDGDPCKYCGLSHDEVVPGPCVEHVRQVDDGTAHGFFEVLSVETLITEVGLEKIKNGIKSIHDSLKPETRALLMTYIESIQDGIRMIESVYGE